MRLPLVLLLVVTGCASAVRTREARRVQRASIVSLYGVERSEGGEDFAKRFPGWNPKARTMAAESALSLYTAEMSRLGWRMVDAELVIPTSEYRERFSADTARIPLVPRRMVAAPLGEDEWLAAQARELKVDAAIVVKLEYCAPGEAPAVVSSVRAVSAGGEVIVDLPHARGCNAREEGRAPAAAASPLPPEKFHERFLEATQASAVSAVQTIRDAMLE